MDIRQFYRHLYEVLDHMLQYPELTAKRKSTEDKIEKTMNMFMLKNIKLSEPIETLLSLGDEDVAYLKDFLIFGYLVDSGQTIYEAYDITVGKHGSKLESYLTKKILNEKYFRKLNNDEKQSIERLYKISFENDDRK